MCRRCLLIVMGLLPFAARLESREFAYTYRGKEVKLRASEGTLAFKVPSHIAKEMPRHVGGGFVLVGKGKAGKAPFEVIQNDTVEYTSPVFDQGDRCQLSRQPDAGS